MTIMADNVQIGYMPTRVWGTPTAAMWVQRLGPERAKRMLFTGDRIDGKQAEDMGLVLQSVPVLYGVIIFLYQFRYKSLQKYSRRCHTMSVNLI